MIGLNTNVYDLLNGEKGLDNIIHNYILKNIFTCELMKVVAVNDDNTVELETIVYNVFTNGETSETKNTLHNINVLMLTGGDIKISFQVAVGDIGLYFSFKKDFSNYLKNIDNTTINKNIFQYTNGVFLPFSLNNTLKDAIQIQKGDNVLVNLSNDLLTIKNNSSLIEIKDNETTMTTQTLTINGNIVVNGNLTGSGTLMMGGITAGGGSIALGEGGAGVARIGDSVNLSTGQIVSGSSSVVAG